MELCLFLGRDFCHIESTRPALKRMYHESFGVLQSRYPNLTMYDVTDLQRATGFTVNQVRDRLDLLSPILRGDFHKGTRGKILVTDGVLAALRRMREIESQGLSPKVAQSEIIRELGNGDGNGQATFGGGLRESELVEVLKRENDRLQEEVRWLRSRVEDLSRLALPRPRRTWFTWLRPRRGVE